MSVILSICLSIYLFFTDSSRHSGCGQFCVDAAASPGIRSDEEQEAHHGRPHQALQEGGRVGRREGQDLGRPHGHPRQQRVPGDLHATRRQGVHRHGAGGHGGHR